MIFFSKYAIIPEFLLANPTLNSHLVTEWVRECMIEFNSLFGTGGHRGPCFQNLEWGLHIDINSIFPYFFLTFWWISKFPDRYQNFLTFPDFLIFSFFRTFFPDVWEPCTLYRRLSLAEPIHFTAQPKQNTTKCIILAMNKYSDLWPLLLTWFNFNLSMDK